MLFNRIHIVLQFIALQYALIFTSLPTLAQDQLSSDTFKTLGAMDCMQNPNLSPIAQLKEMSNQAKYAEDYHLRKRICIEMAHMLATGNMVAPHTRLLQPKDLPFVYKSYQFTEKPSSENTRTEIEAAFTAGFLGGNDVLKHLGTLVQMNTHHDGSPLNKQHKDHRRAVFIAAWRGANWDKEGENHTDGYINIRKDLRNKEYFFQTPNTVKHDEELRIQKGMHKYFSENITRILSEKQKDLSQFSEMVTNSTYNLERKGFLNEKIQPINVNMQSVTLTDLIYKPTETYKKIGAEMESGGARFSSEDFFNSIPEVWLKCLYRMKIEEQMRLERLKEIGKYPLEKEIDGYKRAITAFKNIIDHNFHTSPALRAKLGFLKSTSCKKDINGNPTFFHQVGDVTVPAKQFILHTNKASFKSAIEEYRINEKKDDDEFEDKSTNGEDLGLVRILAALSFINKKDNTSKMSIQSSATEKNGSYNLFIDYNPGTNNVGSYDVHKKIINIHDFLDIDPQGRFVEPKKQELSYGRTIFTGLDTLYKQRKQELNSLSQELKQRFIQVTQKQAEINKKFQAWEETKEKIAEFKEDVNKSEQVVEIDGILTFKDGKIKNECIIDTIHNQKFNATINIASNAKTLIDTVRNNPQGIFWQVDEPNKLTQEQSQKPTFYYLALQYLFIPESEWGLLNEYDKLVAKKQQKQARLEILRDQLGGHYEGEKFIPSPVSDVSALKNKMKHLNNSTTMEKLVVRIKTKVYQPGHFENTIKLMVEDKRLAKRN